MKRFSVVLAAAVVICLHSSSEVSLAQHKHHKAKSVSKDDSSHEQYDKKGSAIGKTNEDSTSAPHVIDPKAAASIKEIVGRYLDLKNALANDKTIEAATAGTALEGALKKFDKKHLTASQRKVYEDLEDDAREHGEHIGASAGNIEHQREHFAMLSNDMYDLAKAFGGGQLLYRDYCPMYNGKKGAIWLSETRAIKNPYYGMKMLKCGSVKEEIK